MRKQRLKLAVGAAILLAASAAMAAQKVTFVGTIDRHEHGKLYVTTDDGTQFVRVDGIDLDATLAEGDMVRVVYSNKNGIKTATDVSRVATVRVSLPEQSGVETLVVDNVEEGSLASIAGKGNIRAKVMLSVANKVTIRTADPDAPVVAFRAHRPSGTTGFQSGDKVVLRVPTPVIRSTMNVNTEPVLPPRREPERVAVIEAEDVTATEPEPEPEPAMTDSHDSWEDEENYQLPQTASLLHAVGIAGLAALTCAALLGFSRRLW